MALAGVVKTDDFEMDYCTFGKGDRIFVIIPGLSVQSVMGSKDAIEKAYELFGDDFTVYVFDRKRSIPEGYSVSDMADDTAAAMKQLGLDEAYIFGASQGGMIGMMLAIKYPELVSKLALGSTSSHVHRRQQKVINEWIRLAQNKDSAGLYDEFGKEIYPPDVYEQFRDSFAEAAKSVTDKDLERFVILARAVVDFNITGQLKMIDCPVLALGEFEDEVLDSDATMEIAENLDYRSDFSLYMYKGYGHAAFDTAPDYKKRLYDFYMKP